jgi:hypothetical protein
VTTLYNQGPSGDLKPKNVYCRFLDPARDDAYSPTNPGLAADLYKKLAAGDASVFEDLATLIARHEQAMLKTSPFLSIARNPDKASDTTDPNLRKIVTLQRNSVTTRLPKPGG